MYFKDQVVIITGSSSGIGKSLAYVFAEAKAQIVLAARNKEKLDNIAEDLKKQFQVNILVVATDVSIEADCQNLIEQTIKVFGKIDILINNAGVSMRALFEELDLSVIRRLMDVNFWGTVYCSKYAIPHLLESKGSLVGISSIAGYRGLPARSGYSASKFAVQGFLEVVRVETLKRGLHVLIACPGFTHSNIRNTALIKDGSAQGESPRDENKMMSSDEVARRILKAIRKRKRMIIMTCLGKATVFFNKIFPKWMDKMTYRTMAKEPNSPLK